jgi:pyruvate carboxylase
LDIWFEGLEVRKELEFTDSTGKPHKMMILDISEPRKNGTSVVRYLLDSEVLTHQVKVKEPETANGQGREMADPGNKFHLASPSKGDLWVMYVTAGDYVKKGDEIFNVSIMKQEKAVFAPFDAMVKRVVKTANYSEDRKMVPVKEGELLVELAPAPTLCRKCALPLTSPDFKFCPSCGEKTGGKD